MADFIKVIGYLSMAKGYFILCIAIRNHYVLLKNLPFH